MLGFGGSLPTLRLRKYTAHVTILLTIFGPLTLKSNHHLDAGGTEIHVSGPDPCPEV